MPNTPDTMTNVDEGYRAWAEASLRCKEGIITVEMHMLLMQVFRAGWAGGYVDRAKNAP